ncbi:hypothetical protein [Actinoplanes sp. NPDC049802]|uniref:hypothetical protein n=1 Tax=Actinoplanes sp. NPDC049802 TaxID=3154742 RepID=UPI0033F40B9F
MPATGTLIGESLRTEWAPTGTRIRRVHRVDQGDTVGLGQPRFWTVIEFETDDATLAAETLSRALQAEGGWYADLWAGQERIIIFAGRIFRFALGDEQADAEAKSYGRSAGVPEHQLDW